MRVEYEASPTLKRFHRSNAFVRGIKGPIGSGKSTACCWEIFKRINEQAKIKGREYERYSRWAIIRNTYRELEDTTIATWLDWFPEQIGRFNRGTMTHEIRFQGIHADILFRALDNPKDVKKLLSLELTGAWVNEAKEVPRGVIDMLQGRVGRYPAMKDGGPSWYGVIMDTNPPDTDHWWYTLFEEDRPDDWVLFSQPGGRSPDAENIGNLVPGYYNRIMSGKKPTWIKVYIDGDYGFVADGKPVYPEFVDSVHVADVEPTPKRPIIIGLDFGLTPAAVFAQEDVMGRWIWFDELVTEDMGAKRFAGELKKAMSKYQGYEFEIWGDPAGDDRAQTDEQTPYKILEANGIPAQPAPGNNDPVLRREAVAEPLGRLIDGVPGLRISPRCKVTRKGMAGGYCYKRVQVVGDDKFHDKPDKNKFSHPCEAGQYAMLGGGEGNKVTGFGDYKYPDQIEEPSSWMS